MLSYHETIHTTNLHKEGYLLLHHLAGATIQFANLVNYNCQEDGNQEDGNRSVKHSLGFLYSYYLRDPLMFGGTVARISEEGENVK